ncbi:MAG: ZIP zinc transporter [Gallionellales bacterium RIFCSPLOWO2_12_FULL_59_22]|nr:MAG: ZIP zinc transporter [Gallionellales bacterium RIFCSPLOWO2_02_FULL_59_110]OGT03438.1 MAG: ZIP zinc transporter [Gallionellales bacterium RIFCSPLOWO2_02_58_13]OGT12734.1 MAG: ZIP zinc transporter [Gallionellales bacterium RIFCSPLOWO2_12_FULL_59_22]
MTTLSWIIAASLAGGILSVLCAALFALNARAHWVGSLVSYAIGALLGAVFLDILPEAMETGSSAAAVSGTVLAGILLFFTLEKLLLWRHCHHSGCEVHECNEHGRSGTMIMIGDTFHNFVDGVIIAAAFLADTQLGIVTALAVIAHEIPQEVGDFLILMHSGYSKAQALRVNLLSSLAMLVGGVLAYFALQSVQSVVPVLLALAASNMIYVAVADLIPGLHKRTQLRDTVQQVALIALGVGSIFLIGVLVHE